MHNKQIFLDVGIDRAAHFQTRFVILVRRVIFRRFALIHKIPAYRPELVQASQAVNQSVARSAKGVGECTSSLRAGPVLVDDDVT